MLTADADSTTPVDAMPPAEAPKKFGAFGPKKAAPAPEATPIDLFSKRNEQPTAAGADALLHQRAEEALNRTVINDVPRAAPTPEDFARHIEQHAVEVKVGDYKVEWTEKWGPYKDNRLLLADIFKQIAAREFDVSKFDANAKFKATAFNKVWCAILGWPTEIVSGARAVKEIDGVGKSAGEKIDKILKDKRIEHRDVIIHPLGTMDFSQLETKKEKKEREKEQAKRAAADADIDGADEAKPKKARKPRKKKDQDA